MKRSTRLIISWSLCLTAIAISWGYMMSTAYSGPAQSFQDGLGRAIGVSSPFVAVSIAVGALKYGLSKDANSAFVWALVALLSGFSIAGIGAAQGNRESAESSAKSITSHKSIG